MKTLYDLHVVESKKWIMHCQKIKQYVKKNLFLFCTIA